MISKTIFGSLFRGIDNPQIRLNFVRSQIEVKFGLGANSLSLIGASDHAEVYAIQSKFYDDDRLVVKTPPFQRLGELTKDGLDAFDEGCFAILDEMSALSQIGNCAFINTPQYAALAHDVPILIFRKCHADLRQLIMANMSAADMFVRLATLQMIAKGLVAAQQQGVMIHQDLKPENILINYMSVDYHINDEFPALVIPRINDFELTNRLIGKRLRGFRPYLPAEHYEDFTAEIGPDNRYDIYSLAILAHELLTCGFHPMPSDDPSGLHCSAYVNGYAAGLEREKKWKNFARKPASEKSLPAIKDRTLATVLSAALDPDYQSRPSAAELAGAFSKAMVTENPIAAKRVSLTIDYLEESGEIGSGASSRFAEQAKKILANSPAQSGN